MMDPQAAAEAFAAFPFCVKSLSPESASVRYLVYKTPDESVSVQAASADEALKMSGIEHPVRIHREAVSQMLMLERGMFD